MEPPTNLVLYLIPAVFVVAYAILTRLLGRVSIVPRIRGPPSPSWIVGHEKALRDQDQVGDLEFSWLRQYGSIFRLKGIFGDNVLMISDAKALQHILHSSGYRYSRAPAAMRVTAELFGHGILSVGGTTHQRHRKVLNPGFSAGQLKTFSTLFQRLAHRLTNRMLTMTNEDNSIINIHAWLGRVTLDAIGETAFGYKFGALDDEDNELANIVNKLFIDAGNMTAMWHVSNWLWAHLPEFFHYFIELFPTKKARRFHHFHSTSKRVAKALLSEAKSGDEIDITLGKDMLSILVRANSSEDPKKQLTEDEVLSQAATLILAGHETSSSTLAWMLYELSKRLEQQDRIRREITEVRQRYSEKGELTTNDYNGMPFLNAVIKETLRLHPILPIIQRAAECDDTIPLAEPIYTTDGVLINAIPVEKGQLVHVAVHCYNRNPTIWGSDADVWNPDRWLNRDESEKTTVGVYANVLTFSAGVRSCIGWRFAVMEMQAITFELLENFRFTFPERTDVKRQPSGLMIPMTRGRLREGSMMPLRVAPL